MLPPRPRDAAAYRWLYESLRREILEGRLRPGTRLPSTRDIASQYSLSRGTIVSAFDQLREEGYLEGNIGSGTYVSEQLPRALLHAGKTPVSAPPASAPPRRLSQYAQRVRNFWALDPRPPRCFRAHRPALDLFPIGLWSQIASKRVRAYTAAAMVGCDTLGYPPLREALATYLRGARGIRCEARQLMIVSGVQEAFDLVFRTVLDPGDRVAIENPGYPGAAHIMESVGAEIASLPLDAEGVVLDPKALRGARLVYTTPAHQFPTGVTMSLARRLALLEWARRTGALVFEDDYDSEYRYSGKPIPALQGLDTHNVVVFAGSFSKLLFPALRIGYVVLPPDLVDAVSTLKAITSRHVPLLEQAVLAEFIEQGHFARHLRRMREVYAERLATLLDSARVRLNGLLELSAVEAGLQTAGWLQAGIEDTAAVAAAAAREIEVTPFSRCTRGPVTRHGLMLGFAATESAEIRRGVRELAIALEECRRT
jgi:GntR family transcriptional regulator/MocR family aminotransferase